jgi:hypothetical protein
MSTQYRLVQSGKTASGQGSSEPVAPRIYLFYIFIFYGIKNYRITDSADCGVCC